MRSVEESLRTVGCHVIEWAGDVFEARQRCARVRPDLVLIDMQLSAAIGSALDVASALSHETDAPIVYLCDDTVVPPAAAGNHGVGCIEKPVTPAKLARQLVFLMQEDPLRRRTPSGRPEPGQAAAEAEANARRLFRDEFLASMAHELRAPLQGVLGFASFLLDGRAGQVSESQRPCLEQISIGANHVLQIVQDVLDLTDTEADTLHVRSEVVDAEQAMREVLQVLQVIAIRRRVMVGIQIDDRLGHVVSDATKIKQVLYNFVSNALKYTPPGGRVDISLRRDDADTFCLEVTDTGPGIPDDLLPDLFDRAERSSRQGRGLFLTHRIVDAMGGSVSAHNRPSGGCAFVARLPMAPQVVQLDPNQRLPRNAP
jgi:signal transduction histidine kinase